MTTQTDAIKLAIEALEIGLDCAQEIAAQVHGQYKGYKPQRHATVDADVAQIEAALAALQEQAREGEAVAPKQGDRVVSIEDGSEGVVSWLYSSGGPYINFDDGCYGSYSLAEFHELFRYAAPQPAQPVVKDSLTTQPDHIPDAGKMIAQPEQGERAGMLKAADLLAQWMANPVFMQNFDGVRHRDASRIIFDWPNHLREAAALQSAQPSTQQEPRKIDFVINGDEYQMTLLDEISFEIRLKSAPAAHPVKQLREAYDQGRYDEAMAQGPNPWPGGLEDFEIRGKLAAGLKCWHRLTSEEAENLVSFFANHVQAAQPVAQPQRCPLCNYQHGHAIGCENNPVDIALKAKAEAAHGIGGAR